ncbi:MAG: stage 0 sporulation protein [Deltaproteobacteria bacterium]|nr:MAG: stage 0 sporulation protein [Deltaproteobacteria bacterium]
MITIVGIQFRKASKIYDFEVKDIELNPGDKVLVETDKGLSIGMVVMLPKMVSKVEIDKPLKQVIRKLNEKDKEKCKFIAKKEEEAFQICLEKIKERDISMKLIKVEYLFDLSKAIFYFTAEKRVDFRELVKDLAKKLKTRIEMRQIGVRDESKMLGGVGICGREFCCSRFLSNFDLVSIKMAKEQNLALNPSKISGACGRLMCCLAFEYDIYSELKKNLPKPGKRIKTKLGDAKVIRQNVLLQNITVELESGGVVTIKPEDIIKD